MKIIGTTGSIKSNSNKITSTTNADWSAIREGTFIKFDNDYCFYTVAKVEKKLFLKSFELIAPNILKINEDIGVNICEDDFVKISYKEYELNTVHKIVSSGKGYKNGDRITLSGGINSLNIQDNTLNPTILEVINIGEGGEIKEVKINQRGLYIEPPGVLNSVNGGTGSGCSVEVSFKLIDFRSFAEKDVQKIEFKSAETYLYLVYPLPKGIKEGKISAEKWELTLSTEYPGDTKLNQPLEIIRDFTPNYNIPLVAKNSLSSYITTNQALTLIDKKLKELEDKINKAKLN